jgi:predicted small integral membrane protein
MIDFLAHLVNKNVFLFLQQRLSMTVLYPSAQEFGKCILSELNVQIKLAVRFAVNLIHSIYFYLQTIGSVKIRKGNIGQDVLSFVFFFHENYHKQR